MWTHVLALSTGYQNRRPGGGVQALAVWRVRFEAVGEIVGESWAVALARHAHGMLDSQSGRPDSSVIHFVQDEVELF
jgi:hypothetical protein